MYDPGKNVTQFKNPWDSPRRGAQTKFRSGDKVDKLNEII